MLRADSLLDQGWARGLEQFFPGDGEMARQMRAFDWSQTELGPPHGWPANLQIAVRLCLTSVFPNSLWWGPHYLLLYNDAYLQRLGEAKRRRALMQPAGEVWAEVWGVIGPMLDNVVATGAAVGAESQEMFYDRRVPREEAFVTWSFSPVLTADGRSVDGVFCQCAEHTQKVVGARRMEMLRQLAARPSKGHDVDSACRDAAALLSQNPRDVPFAAIYVVGPRGDDARCGAMMVSGGISLLPASVSLNDPGSGSPWPIAEVLRSRRATDNPDLQAKGIWISGPAWPEPVREAIVLPLHAAQGELVGLLVVGASPRRPLDTEYRTFVELVAAQVATIIANAKADELRPERTEPSAEGHRAKTPFSGVSIGETRSVRAVSLTDEAPRPLPDAENTLPAGPQELEPVTASAGRILLADDNASLRDYVQGWLSRSYEVELAADGETALAMALAHPPDLVLTDVNMPEHDGLGLLRALRSDRRTSHIPVILLSARGGEEARIQGLQMGANDYLGKPFSARELLARVDSNLKAARAIKREQRLRKFAEEAEMLTQTKLALELSTMTQLHESSRRLLDEADLEGVLAQIMGATVALQNADRGIVQLYDRESRVLRVVAEYGFPPRYGDRLEPIDETSSTASERALASRARVIIEDVLGDAALPASSSAGFRAMQSTPLFGRGGEVLGVISTQFLRPHRPSEHELRLTDLYARQAAEVVERSTAQAELLALKDKLAEDLKAMTLLHDLAARLLSNAGLEQPLEDVLDTAITLAGADFGHVQLYDEATGTLKIVAQRGFEPEYLRYVERTQEKLDTPSRIGRIERVTFEDVLDEPDFLEHLPALSTLSYRALQATPLRGSCGQLLGVITTHFRTPHRPSDRTLRFLSLCARHAEELIERRRAEQALRASNERFRRYFDLGLIGMVISSPSKGCLEVNDELCRILGYERHELLGKMSAELTHPDDVPADAAQLARVVAGEIDGYSLDKRWLRRDGRMIDTLVAAQCVRRSDGSIDYFVGLVLDVTARKTAEAALLEARGELARISRVTTMGELAASIAHEVNQPLTAIITNANACARWLAATPPNLGEANASMDRLVRDAKRAAAVLAGIRSFLKRQPAQRTKFDLIELIVEVMAMMQGQMRANGVSSSLVPARGSALVSGDRVQLQQVMLNLVMNSIEAMALTAGSARRLQIEVDLARPDELRVSVRDTGIGLTFEHRSRIFDAFHTTKPHGMGMGLAISRSIIEAHGGRLWLAPKQGTGETFQFTLPAAS